MKKPNLIFTLLLCLFQLVLFGQSQEKGILKWTDKLSIKRIDVAFIGSHEDKLIYHKFPKKAAFPKFHKKKGTSKILIYDYKKKDKVEHNIKIDLKNWFVKYLIHGGRLHVYVSSLNTKDKEVSYWYAAYQLSDMSEVVPLKLLGKAFCDQSVLYWKRNKQKLEKSTNILADGTIAVVLYHNGTYASNGYSYLDKTDGQITVLSKTGDIVNHYNYDFDREDDQDLGNRSFVQLVMLDDKTVATLQRYEEFEKRGKLMRSVKRSPISVLQINMETKEEKIHFLYKDKGEFPLMSMMDYDDQGNLLIGSIAVVTAAVGKIRKANFILDEINTAGELSQLSKQKIETQDIYSNIIKSATQMNFSKKLLRTTKDEVVFMYGVSIVDRVRNGPTTLVYNSFIEVSSISINKKEKSVNWIGKPMNFVTDHDPYIVVQDGNTIKVFNRLRRFSIAEDGTVTSLKELPEKLPKFKKKIYPKPEFGFLELENEFIIVGTSDNMKLYVGRLKK